MAHPPSRALSSESSFHSADNPRRRVGKACDRCRLKKSKCDGTSPCLRCRADNIICVFGERKKTHDKVHPKGYVEMLEQQQDQLVAGLQETYRRLVASNQWPGQPLSQSDGHPLTHDILATLKIIDPDGTERFEEDVDKIQHRLLTAGAPLLARRGSGSSDDSHASTTASSSKRVASSIHSPVLAQPSPRFTKRQEKAPATDVGSFNSLPAAAAGASAVSDAATIFPSSRFTAEPASTLDDLQDPIEDALPPDWTWQDMPRLDEPPVYDHFGSLFAFDMYSANNPTAAAEDALMMQYSAGLGAEYGELQRQQQQRQQQQQQQQQLDAGGLMLVPVDSH